MIFHFIMLTIHTMGRYLHILTWNEVGQVEVKRTQGVGAPGAAVDWQLDSTFGQLPDLGV